MALRTRISASLQVAEGDILRLFQTFTKEDAVWPYMTPHRYAVAPLTSQVVDFCDVTSAKVVFLQTNKSVHVALTFAATAPTPTPSPATVTILVDGLLYLTTEVTAITITNPNSGATPLDDATVTVVVVGT